MTPQKIVSTNAARTCARYVSALKGIYQIHLLGLIFHYFQSNPKNLNLLPKTKK